MLAFLQSGSLGSLSRSSSTVLRCRGRRVRLCGTTGDTATVREAPKATATLQKQADTNHASKLLNSGLGIVVLKRGKARLFRDDLNPMVYAGAVERCIVNPGDPMETGDVVAVCDGALRCVGFGFYNDKSMFRVRILRHCSGEPEIPWDLNRELLERVRDAAALRCAIGIPSEETNVYRAVNGEGDRLSGLAVDRAGNTLVVSSSALWCERYKENIGRALRNTMPECTDVIWRPNVERLRQDGLMTEADVASKDDDEAAADAPQREESEGEALTVVEECGVKYGLSRFALSKGQKTGHYADQRENRAFVRSLLEQRKTRTRVLDLFCYTGGFALSAALGSKQADVIGVDSSRVAIDMARRNVSLNGVAGRVEFVQSDVNKFIRECDETFDVVILDPPKFAPNAKALARASYKYRRLNAAALRLVKPGGILVTCTCSAAMTREKGLFVETVREAAREAGRQVALVRTAGAAPDHPVAPEMMELEYLTACFFIVR